MFLREKKMKNMKEIVMMVVVAVVAAGAIYVVANKMMNKQDVKIQAMVKNDDETYTGAGSDSDSWKEKNAVKAVKKTTDEAVDAAKN
jgi:hypothetical protein